MRYAFNETGYLSSLVLSSALPMICWVTFDTSHDLCFLIFEMGEKVALQCMEAQLSEGMLKHFWGAQMKSKLKVQ